MQKQVLSPKSSLRSSRTLKVTKVLLMKVEFWVFRVYHPTPHSCADCASDGVT